MDWRIYHEVNSFVGHHEWLGRLFSHLETVGTPLIAVAVAALWLLARPGSGRKWKLAAASGLASAGVALLVNKVVIDVWTRPRPFATHHVAEIWGARKTDPSFPSDHASAAFAIAFAVLIYDRVAGALFLVAAVLIGGGRVVVGEHYPGDVLAGIVVGLATAIVVARLARPLFSVLVRFIERLTDPLLRPLWRAAGR